MKEIKVAKLDKDDVRLLKELNAEKDALETKVIELSVKGGALWDSLRAKHHLAWSKQHYIKDNSIYMQEA